jgi:hypothetical protein
MQATTAIEGGRGFLEKPFRAHRFDGDCDAS